MSTPDTAKNLCGAQYPGSDNAYESCTLPKDHAESHQAPLTGSGWHATVSWPVVTAPEAKALTCDMVDGCAQPVTHIDPKGFVYCTSHGLSRRQVMPCRKLRPAELRKLQRGEQLARY